MVLFSQKTKPLDAETSGAAGTWSANTMTDSTSYSKGFKHCKNPECSQDNPQPLTNFYRQMSSKDHLRAKCKTCVNLQYRQWALANPEKRLAGERRRRNANLELTKEKERASYHRRKARKAETSKVWRSKNLERLRVLNNRRHARKRSLPDELSYQDWQACLEYWDYRCAICGRPAGLWHKIVMDHWIPISDPSCPGTVPQNIIPLCHGVDGCNNSKNNKQPEQWLIDKFGKRKAKKITQRVTEYFGRLGL